MMKYETDFTDYEPLVYYIGDKKYTSNKYKINTTKGTVINNSGMLLKSKTEKKTYHSVGITGDEHNPIRYGLHRLIYEHAKGKIQGVYDVDHIDNNPDNNSIDNLQLLTRKENNLKSAKNRDYTFVKHNVSRAHRVKATNTDTNESNVYKSLYACSKDIGVNVGIIKMCCEGKNNCKSGTSKINNNRYTFCYVEDEPTKQNTRKMTLYNNDEEKQKAIKERAKVYATKEVQCKCGKIILNRYRTLHNRTKHHIDFIEKNKQ